MTDYVRLVPGDGVIQETGSAQRLVPGGMLVSETVAAAASSTATISATTASPSFSGSAGVPSTASIAATTGAATFSGSASAAAGSIALSDLENNRVYQRSGTSKSITVTGTYAGSPTAIQARIVQHGTSTEVVTWTTIVASPSGGTFSGALSVPQGGWYNVQVRFSNDTGIVSNGSNKFGVGIVVLCAGQSNMSYWGTTGTNSSPALAAKQTGSAYPSTTGSWSPLGTTEQGHAAFANALISAYSIPVGILNYAAAGAAVTSWDDAADGLVQNAVKAVSDAGGAVEYILWAQGEAEALSGMAKATYKTHLASVISTLRAGISNGSTRPRLPFLAGTLGRENYSGVTDATMAAIREAIQEVIADGTETYIGASALDVYSDNVHYTGAGYAVFAGRFAQTVKYICGTESYHRGPYITSAAIVDVTHTDVNISHRGGTDFTPTSGINGFEIDDGGTVVVPSAAVRQSANVVRLTHSALSSGAPTVRYGYGCDGGVAFANTYTGALLDNTAMALPLEQYSGIPITASVSITSTAANATFSGSAHVSPRASFAATTTAAVASTAATGASQGTITTPALKNNTGTVLANETGATVYVYAPDTGVLVVKKTGQTTNESGVLVVTDASISSGTQYRIVVVLGSGAEGMDKLTAS